MLFGDVPCDELGHFYENHRCIYCDVDFCQAEQGGHSFEHSMYQAGKSPEECWYCHRRLVNLRKK